jgi:hypothetical protein
MFLVSELLCGSWLLESHHTKVKYFLNKLDIQGVQVSEEVSKGNLRP